MGTQLDPRILWFLIGSATMWVMALTMIALWLHYSLKED